MTYNQKEHDCHNCGSAGYPTCPEWPDEPKTKSCGYWSKYPPCPKCKQNRHAPRASRFTGVHIAKAGHFRAQIKVHGRVRHLGTFNSDVEASRCYTAFSNVIELSRTIPFTECSVLDKGGFTA